MLQKEIRQLIWKIANEALRWRNVTLNKINKSMKLHKHSRSSHRRTQITPFVSQTKKPADVPYMPFDGRSKFFSPNSFSNSLQCQRFRKNQRACRRMAIIRAHRNRIKNNQRFPRYTYRVHGIIVPLSWVPWIRHWRGKRVPCCVFHANESRRSNQRSVIGLNSA